MRQAETIAIQGMHCGACVQRVTRALSSLPSVQVEQVQVGSARISYEPGAVTEDTIAQAIRKTGFEPVPRG